MMRILIVDDHELIRQGLRDLLAREFAGVTVAEAADARQALTLMSQGPWHLVLLDINLPGRSGLEVLRDFRRVYPKTPVLVLSAYPEEEFALRAIKLGAAAYLNKQRAASELLAAIRKVLAGGRYLTATVAEHLAASLGEDFGRDPHEALSGRELEVLRMIALGKTLKEIAGELALGERTISTYRSRIAQKLGLSTNVELTRYALQHRLAE